MSCHRYAEVLVEFQQTSKLMFQEEFYSPN